ncbi:MAG TPA: exodeoxyribonuclease V subunit beta [Rhodocyclaceae bacterium]|nr:exodeoxyribonuclease V subunit beta [Rhodocyclaceae bacterium]
MTGIEAQDLDVFHCPLDGVRLIEASAGTGKTWTICGLYLRLLLEAQLEVQQILVVTFTRAATAELKSRIRGRIVETLAWLDGADSGADPFVARLVDALEARGHSRDVMRKRLDPVLQAFDEAAIFTIHGYCQRALADTPFAAGLPFALELGEDDLELRLEASRDFWRRHVASDSCSAELGDLLVRSGDSPERWAGLLRRCMARPLALTRWPEASDERGHDPGALAEAFASAALLWGGDGAEATAVLLAALGELNAQTYKAEAVTTAARGWSALFAGADPLARISGAKLELFGAAMLAEKTKKNCDTPQHPFFDAAARLLDLRDAALAHFEFERLQLLRRFVEETSGRLRALKRERRQIAFDDILYNVHQALSGGRNPWLAADLQRRYPAALIDEFQDTDPLQFDIFRRVYDDAERHGRLFLVGDPKQAIYSFRNADLHAYLGARDHADTRYTLRENQRSVAGLIRACNGLFGVNPGAFVLDGLNFTPATEGARPRPPFVDEGSPDGASLRVWSIPCGEDGEPVLRAEAMHRATAATAAEIARLIRDGMEGRVRIGERSLRAGDIAVLVKSHRQGARMREALAELGVGSVELSQASVFHGSEAEELERVLLAIEEPSRQPLMHAALATTLMGLDAGALERLAADESRLMDTIARFARWRESWLERGCGVMLREWMNDAGVVARLFARDDGERRLTNLLHLAECLNEAAATHPSPDALLRWFSSRRSEAGSGEATQLRLESDRNLVQIVTVHRSKGLEYGVVFCPFLFDAFVPRGGGDEERVYHKGANDGVVRRLVMDFRPEARDDAMIKACIRREKDAEFIRLTYVALTRAVHRCYLVGGVYRRKYGKSATATESTRSLLNWLVAGAGVTHDAWVEGERPPEEIMTAWRALEAAVAPELRIEEMPASGGQRVSTADTSAETLHALAPPAQIPGGWRIGSFSALNHGAVRDEAARDHDARSESGRSPQAATDAGDAARALAPDDILFFPRGPVAGDCVHAVFENLDFTDPSGREAAIEAALAAHPQGPGNISANDALQLQRRMLHGMVDNVLAMPLPDGIVLKALDNAKRLVELAFHLPAPRLSSAELNDWLARHGYRMPRLGFSALSGYLKGFIDLVFEHGGRFYVLDWKSNHLGFSAQDYAPERLEEAMQSHGYHLQHLLYSVALHRHLRRSLPDYSFDKHFGGALYLFVRGVRPAWQARAQGAGVFFHRPDPSVIESLDRLVGGHASGEVKIR